jgi:hypothetical protein
MRDPPHHADAILADVTKAAAELGLISEDSIFNDLTYHSSERRQKGRKNELNLIFPDL